MNEHEIENLREDRDHTIAVLKNAGEWTGNFDEDVVRAVAQKSIRRAENDELRAKMDEIVTRKDIEIARLTLVIYQLSNGAKP